MHTIHLEQLKNYSNQLILEYLLLAEEKTFEIILQKEQDDTPGLNQYFISWNYQAAAYAGQLLFNIADSFATYIPCPKKIDPFRFEVSVTDITALAGVLSFILDGYINDEEATIRFQNEAALYFEQVIKGEIHSACNTLLDIAFDHLTD